MNLKEIIESEYKVFQRMKEENRKEQIDIIKYIDLLTTSARINPSSINIFELFGTGKGFKLITKKAEINKRLFEYKDSLDQPKNIKDSLNNLSSEEEREKMLASINEISKALYNEQIADIESLVKYAKIDAEEYYTNFNRKMEEVFRLSIQLSHLKKQDSGMVNQINLVLEDGFFNDPYVEDKFLYLSTKENIICSQRNDARDINIRVDFGKFLIKVDLTSLRIIVLPLENNRHVTGHVHPYINTVGEICWGSGADTYTTAVANLDFRAIARLLAHILINYREDSVPHRNLYEFNIRQDREMKDQDVVLINLKDANTFPPSLVRERNYREKLYRSKLNNS